MSGSGATLTTLYSTGSAHLGWSVAGAGDVNGDGWPGTQGVPTLEIDQAPIYNSSPTILVGNSLGGRLLVLPSITRVVAISGNGQAFPFDTPTYTGLCHPPFYLQMLMDDPGASNGMSFTPGLELKFGLIPDR